MGGRLVCRADLVWAPLNPLKAWRVERYWRWATHAKQQSPTAGFQPKGWPFGLQRRSRLGTFEPAKSMEVSALGNPCETAEPLQDSGPMGGRLVCRADLVWAPLNPLKTWRVERYWRWATHANLEGRPYTENAYTELTYTKTGFYGHKALSRTHRRFHVHTGVFTIFTFFHVHSWFFHVHLHTFSRTYFGFHVHLLFSRPHLVFAYTPPFSSSFGQTDFGHIFRVQMVPQETAEPLQDSGPMGGRLVCRADLVWAPLNPLKAWRVERYWRWATHAKQQSPTAGFQPKGWPFGLQCRSRLGTFEPAESMEVSALGNPCETAEPLQDSGPMGGRLVCRADLVWAPLNPLKTWRVERYWRWATHAKRQSPCRIQAQWVAVWSAEPISFGHL